MQCLHTCTVLFIRGWKWEFCCFCRNTPVWNHSSADRSSPWDSFCIWQQDAWGITELFWGKFSGIDKSWGSASAVWLCNGEQAFVWLSCLEYFSLFFSNVLHFLTQSHVIYPSCNGWLYLANSVPFFGCLFSVGIILGSGFGPISWFCAELWLAHQA